MFIFINMGAGGGNWYVAPGFFLCMLLFNSGILRDLFLHLGSWGGGENGSMNAYMLLSFHVLIGIVIGGLLFALVLLVKRVGFWPALRRAFITGFGGGFRQGGDRRSPRENIDRISKIIQKLPTEPYIAPEKYCNLSIHSLMERLSRCEVDVSGFTEKSELVAALQQSRYASNSSCSICYEDYDTDDILRVLPCNHNFHLECIDRWFLSSPENIKPLTCPYCNSSI
ncbi:hypothetical protein BSKO_00917 [Bryopsis sp. KO-2023]|nr:hypothetical protein BSKO_00917 [Bryopsis sp. KO-2023]